MTTHIEETLPWNQLWPRRSTNLTPYLFKNPRASITRQAGGALRAQPAFGGMSPFREFKIVALLGIWLEICRERWPQVIRVEFLLDTGGGSQSHVVRVFSPEACSRAVRELFVPMLFA